MSHSTGAMRAAPRGISIGPSVQPRAAAFGGPDNQYIYFEGAISGTFWRFKAPHPGLIGPGGVLLPAQP